LKNGEATNKFLDCIDATGNHKVQSLVIGKSKTPRAFKIFACPVDYDHLKSAWMTANDSNITEALKNLTINDTVVKLMGAWNRLDSKIIAKCWRNILRVSENNEIRRRRFAPVSFNQTVPVS
jgi:hypothetical protein